LFNSLKINFAIENNIQVYVTIQNPKAFGPISKLNVLLKQLPLVPEISSFYPKAAGLIREYEKISFSMLQDEALLSALPETPCRVFLWGVLAEACIL
jgi:hypothetical protein